MRLASTLGLWALFVLVSGGSRGKRDLCTTEHCFDDLGCIPCKHGHGSYSPADMEMSFYFYSGSAREQILQYDDFEAPTKMSELLLSPSEDVWVIVHGFEGQWPLEWLDIMRRKLVSQGNTVVVARWTAGTAYPHNFPQAVVNGLTVGKMIGRVLIKLKDAKSMALSRVNILGFSLGVHVAGHAGAAVGGAVRQIVGLDPPEKLYQSEPAEFRLDPSDAQLVQVIHTHGASLLKGGLGTLMPMGHVDLYVNGGEAQPGCPITERDDFDISKFYDIIKVVGCNHIRSTALFSDSIANSCAYTAYPCADDANWKRGQCFSCPQEGCLKLGYRMDTNTTQRGKFFVNTLIDQGINEPKKAYCGTQYRVSLFPDKEVKGIIDLTIIDGSYSSEAHEFQGRTSTLYGGGRSGIVVASTRTPRQLKLEYNRFNALVKKSAWSFQLQRAVLIRDDGQAFQFNGSAAVEDDYSTTVELRRVALDVPAFLADTTWYVYLH